MQDEPNKTAQDELNPPKIQAEDTTNTEVSSFEEPVMITANIEDLPESERPVITAPIEEKSQPVEPDDPQQLNVGFELGKKEEPKEETVPTFQQFGEIPSENKIEEKTEVEQLESKNEITPEPIPSSLTELYQAKPTNVTTESTTPEQVEEKKEETVETLEDEYDNDEPKKKPKLLLIIMFIIVLLIVGGFIFIKLTGKEKAKVETKTVGKINIAVVGDINSNKDKLYTTLIKNTDITKCEEKNLLETKYSIIDKELRTGKSDYNIIYPCGYENTIKYLVVSDSIDKVDGALLVVKDEVKEQTIEVTKVLQNIGVSKLIVFIEKSDNDETTKKIQKDVEDLLVARGFDKTHTPIIIGKTSEENDIKKLETEADSWFENTKVESDTYALQKHKIIKLYTYIKPTTEGGITSSIKNSDSFDLKINDTKAKGEVELPETITEIKAGTNTDITIKLEKEVSIAKGMRIPFYKDSKIVAIGVVDEIIE